MTLQLSTFRRASFNRLVLCTVPMLALVARPLPARGADLADQAHSLKKVPADSAFYSSSLRMKEQWTNFTSSKAYSKLMEIPLLQIMKMQASFQWQQTTAPGVAQVREYLESPAGQDAVAILKEMFSDEVFAYGGNNIADWLKFALEMNTKANEMRVKIAAGGDDDADATAKKDVLKFLTEKLKSNLSVPTFVVGFRIKDSDRAKRELDEIHSLLRNVLDEHQPDLAAHLQRDQIAGHEFLTLRLDGSMIPWDKIHEEESEKIDEEEFKSIRDAISKQTLVVALGIADEFVLLSVGSSTDHLEKIGQGATLADNPAIKRLEKHAGERIVSLTYLSKTFAESLGSPKQTLESIATSVEEGLIQAKVDEEDRKTILDDIRAFNITKYMPEPSETSAVAFMTARGYEAYQYATAKPPMLDSSKPLSILSHVGGSPLMVLAGRSKETIEDYNEFVTWLKKIAGDGVKIYEKVGDEDEVAEFKKIHDRAVTLLEGLDKTNRENLIPALADGQSAFVLDVSATSKQWFREMPEATKPLPMLEAAFVVSVSDAEKLHTGIADYANAAHDYYEIVREVDPDKAPEIDWPKAEVKDMADGGKLYSYPLPEQWGVDPQVVVNAGLNDKFAVASFMPKTTERMLHEQANKIDTSLPLDKPAAVVAHFEFAKMIETTRPWIDYGMDVATGKIKPKAKKNEDGDESEDSDEDKATPPPSSALIQMGLVVPQFQQFLEVLTAFRSGTMMTYEEDGAWITHSETHFEDLK